MGVLGAPSLDASGAAATERTGQGEVNVLLGVDPDHEGWHVDDLLAHPTADNIWWVNTDIASGSGMPGTVTLQDRSSSCSRYAFLTVTAKQQKELRSAGTADVCESPPEVALADEHACVVDGLSQALLEHDGLQAALKEVLRGQGQNVIQLVLRLVQQRVLIHTPHQSLPLEDALGVLLVQGQQSTSSVTDFGQNHLHAPQLSLVAQAILSDQFQLGIQAFLLKRAARPLEGLAICTMQRKGSNSDEIGRIDKVIHDTSRFVIGNNNKGCGLQLR
jgi:hypothetical protein